MVAPVVARNSLPLVVANQFSRVINRFPSNIARSMATTAALPGFYRLPCNTAIPELIATTSSMIETRIVPIPIDTCDASAAFLPAS
jgi:hypothetical protein